MTNPLLTPAVNDNRVRDPPEAAVAPEVMILAQALEARVRALQAKLATASGVAPQLKRRPEVKDGLQTWMEIYPVVGEGFAELLATAADEAGLLSLTAGGRHTEVFMDLPPCA